MTKKSTRKGSSSSSNSSSSSSSSRRSDAKVLAGHQKMKSIVFVIGSSRDDVGRACGFQISHVDESSGKWVNTDYELPGWEKAWWATCYQVSHDESGTPTLKTLFDCTQCEEDYFAYQRIGSRMYSFRCKRGSQENISYLDLEKEAANWVKTDFYLPITTGRTFTSGVYRNWLYLIGFQQFDPESCHATSVWGKVYNVGNGSDVFELNQPPSSVPLLLDPQALGPWNKDGLAVYTSQDNTLRVHNPETQTWKILAKGIVKREMCSYTVHLCGNIFYTFHWTDFVLEAYDIARKKPRPQVQFDRAKDFPDFHPYCLHVLSDGVLCFTSFEYDELSYSRFFINYKSSKPKPCSTKRMNIKCEGGLLMSIKTE